LKKAPFRKSALIVVPKSEESVKEEIKCEKYNVLLAIRFALTAIQKVVAMHFDLALPTRYVLWDLKSKNTFFSVLVISNSF